MKELERLLEEAEEARRTVFQNNIATALVESLKIILGLQCPMCGRTGALDITMGGIVRCSLCSYAIDITSANEVKHEPAISKFFKGSLHSGSYPGLGAYQITKHHMGDSFEEPIWLEELVYENQNGEREVLAIRIANPLGYRPKGDDIYSGYVCEGNSKLQPRNMEKERR